MTRTSTTPDPLDDLRLELERAAERLASQARPARPSAGRRRRRRPLLAAGVTVLLGGAIGLTTALDTGQVDPIQATAAAISTDGDTVFHITFAGGPTDPDGKPVRSGLSRDGRTVEGFFDRRFEQWSTTRPLRFRASQSLTRPDGRPLGTFDTGVTGDGRSWTNRSWDRQPPATQRLTEAAPNGDADTVGAFGAADPLAKLRAGIKDGSVREDGTGDIDGTPVLRLVEDSRNARTEYLVDPDNHQPRELRRFENGRLVDVLRITSFERLSTSASNLKVFTIPTEEK